MATNLEILLTARGNLNKEIREARRELNGIGTATRGASTGLDRTGKSADRLGTKLKTATSSASGLRAALVSVGALILFRSAISTIARFEQSMANVRAVMLTVGDAAEDADAKFAALSAEARRLGGTTVFSATQAAEGLLFLGRAGFSAQQSLDSLEGTLALAAAGGIDLASAADIATNVLAGFGLAADQAGRVADVLAFTASNANTDIRELGEAMKFVAPIAASLNVPIEDAAAAVGILSNAGLKGSLAGTGLRKVIVKLSSPTAKLSKVMAGLGLEIADVNPSGPNGLTQAMEALGNTTFSAVEAIELFGDRGAPAALSMANMSNELKALTNATRDQENAALDMAKVMTDTLIGDFKLLTSAIEETLIASGEKGLLRDMRSVIQVMAGVVRVLNGTADPLHEDAVLFRQLANAAESFVLVIKTIIAFKIISILGSLATGLATSVVAFRTATIAASGLAATLKVVGRAALAALGPLGWIIGIGLALVDFARNDAVEAVGALKDVDAELSKLRENVEGFTAEQLANESRKATSALKELESQLNAARQAQDDLISGNKRVAGRKRNISSELGALGETKDAISAEIELQKEKIKVLSELTAKQKSKEEEAIKIAQKRLAKLEGQARQAEVSAIIAQRKLAEESALSQLTTNLRISKQQEKEGRAILNAELKAKEISIEDFYDRTEELALNSLSAEIAIAQQKVDAQKKANEDALSALSDGRDVAVSGGNTEAEIKAIKETFAARKLIQQAQNAELLLDDTEALKAKLDQRAIIIAESNSKESIALGKKLEDDKKKQEISDKKELDDQKKLFDLRLAAILLQRDREIAAEERERVTGQSSSFTLGNDIAAIDQETIDKLTQLRLDMEAFNVAANDSELSLSIAAIGDNIVAMADRANVSLEQVQTRLADGLSGAIDNIATGTQTAKEAFKSFALSFLRDIARMIIQAQVLQAVKAVSGGFSGGGAVTASGGGFISAKKGGSIEGFAEGGFITGKGTSTSDSIPARLSNGEYVIQQRAVKHYGVNFIEAVNRMQLGGSSREIPNFKITRPRRARFAAGGVVAGANATKQPEIKLRVINNLDPELVSGFLNSRAGEETFINMISDNKDTIKGLLT